MKSSGQPMLIFQLSGKRSLGEKTHRRLIKRVRMERDKKYAKYWLFNKLRQAFVLCAQRMPNRCAIKINWFKSSWLIQIVCLKLISPAFVVLSVFPTRPHNTQKSGNRKTLGKRKKIYATRQVYFFSRCQQTLIWFTLLSSNVCSKAKKKSHWNCLTWVDA